MPSPSMCSGISSFTDLSGPEEEPLILNSLFDVVKRLPGFTKHQSSGFYYVNGMIDQESLYDYTKRIGELTLGAGPDSESHLAMHVLVRITRLQDPNNPLFPSLHHLRIPHTSKYLDFLDIFLPSSITTIELTAISDDDPYYSSVLSFLECAVDKAPHVSTLILGPGRIQDQILRISSKYQHLRRLEMRNVGISITDQLLRDIGSLQHLETFVLLDNGTSTYSRSSEIPRQQDLKPDAAMYVSSPAYPVSSGCNGFAFSPEPQSQQDFEIDEGVYVSSPLARSPPQRLFPGSSYVMDGEPPPISPSARSLCPESTVSLGNGAAVVDTPVTCCSLFPALRTLEVNGSFSLIEGLVTKVGSSDLQVLSIDFTGPIRRNHKVTSSQKASISLQSPLRSIQTCGNTLVTVSLKNDCTTNFSLPSDLFENLLLGPAMESLEITGIEIDSTDIKLHRLEEVCSKLKILHLPIHSTTPSIAFVELRYIAENCPNLKSLRCQLRSFGDIPVSIPKSHGLQVLSVSNAEVQLKQQPLIKISRYLDSAFPNLETIMTHNNRKNAEQWGVILDMVKVCQAVRRDECARRGFDLA